MPNINNKIIFEHGDTISAQDFNDLQDNFEKQCRICNKQLNINLFNKDKCAKDGLSSRCKECNKIVCKKYYLDNTEKERNRHKKYYYNNIEQCRERNQDWCKKNRVGNPEYNNIQKEKRILNPKLFYGYYRKFYITNKQKINTQNKQWKKNNPFKVRIHNVTRKNRKLNVLANLTNEEWISILSSYSYKCAYCRVKLNFDNHKSSEYCTQDHVLPLFLGGEYTAKNIVPCCKKCNFSKGKKLLKDWIK